MLYPTAPRPRANLLPILLMMGPEKKPTTANVEYCRIERQRTREVDKLRLGPTNATFPSLLTLGSTCPPPPTPLRAVRKQAKAQRRSDFLEQGTCEPLNMPVRDSSSVEVVTTQKRGQTGRTGTSEADERDEDDLSVCVRPESRECASPRWQGRQICRDSVVVLECFHRCRVLSLSPGSKGSCYRKSGGRIRADSTTMIGLAPGRSPASTVRDVGKRRAEEKERESRTKERKTR